MASLQAFFSRLLLLFIHLGCFAIFSNPNPEPEQGEPQPKRRKIAPALSPSPSISNLKPHKSFSTSILSYLNHLLSFCSKPPHDQLEQQQQKQEEEEEQQQQQQPLPSPLQSLSLSPDITITNKLPPPSPELFSSNCKHSSSFATRSTDIFPCPTCGEVLTKPQLLELHQATKHSLSELRDGDSGKNIVQIIFHSGWKGGKPPAILRILKIHNSPKTLSRFEEYREIVRSRAAMRNRGGGDGRCIADGNERLRFYCSTILCALGGNGAVEITGSRGGVCGTQYCGTCAIVRHGFAGKQADLDGIATHATGWGAHVSLPEELEREFSFLHVRRAMLVCRVVAGRVARGGEEAEEEKKGAVFDSVVPVGRREEEELLVFNPRAVLPCFVIIYSV